MKPAMLLFSSVALATALSGARPLYAEGSLMLPAVQGHEHEHAAPADAPKAQQPAANGHRMMQSMSAGDAELTRLLEAMNAATGADKTTAMAALLTRLVEDRKAMHAMMHGSASSAMPHCPMMSKDSSSQQHEH